MHIHYAKRHKDANIEACYVEFGNYLDACACECMACIMQGGTKKQGDGYYAL